MHKAHRQSAAGINEDVSVPSDSLPRQLHSLQWLRAIGALAVVYFHAAIQVSHFNSDTGIPVVGETGVDIFFVLSGFIMWITTRNSDIRTLEFIKKRIIRIVPLYWFLTIIVSAIALVIPHLLKSTKFNSEHLLASLTFVPWPNPAGTPGTDQYLSPVIVPGWTLNMEMAFYVLFSLCLPFGRRWRVAGLSLLIVALYGVGLWGSKSGSITAFYGTTVIFEFLMGVLLGACLIPFLRLSPPWAWGLLALAIIILIWVEAIAPNLTRAVKFGLPALFAIAAAVNLERLSAVPDFPAMVKLGDASYSIYLSHIFVLAGLRITVNLLGLELVFWSGIGFVIIALAASAILGIVIHEYLERPMSRIVASIGNHVSKRSNTATS